jgi:hypothetical protein
MLWIHLRRSATLHQESEGQQRGHQECDGPERNPTWKLARIVGSFQLSFLGHAVSLSAASLSRVTKAVHGSCRFGFSESVLGPDVHGRHARESHPVGLTAHAVSSVFL